MLGKPPSVKQAETVRKKLLNGLTVWVERELSGPAFIRFAQTIHGALPRAIPFSVVEESLTQFAGQRVSKRQLDDLAWLLSGNLARLADRRIVLPWSRQLREEWTTVQVVKVAPALGGKRQAQLGGQITLQILTGSAAGRLITVWWPQDRIRYMAFWRDANKVRGFGFQRARGDRGEPVQLPYRDIRQYVGLRYTVHLEPQYSQDQPGFRVQYFTPQDVQHNRQLQKARALRGTEKAPPCPLNRPLTAPCYQCPAGLDQCPLAVHTATFVRRQCTECQKQAYHDPAERRWSGCLLCVAKQATSKD